jgi:repressor LexA
VAAGVPIEAVTDNETIAVPEDFLTRGGEHYVLRVRGDSMIDEQIRDGDFVIVNARRTASNGEMVVALVGGESATVKKFYRENGRVRLQPANATMPPMFYREQEVAVQGIVIGVIRRY